MTVIARIALDTSAYSHLRRGDPRVHDLLAKASVVGVPTIVLGELHAAFLRGTRAGDNQLLLSQLLDQRWVTLLPVDDAVALRYGDVHKRLRDSGTPISANDVWIAATCIVHGFTLLTFDRDFQRVAGLEHALLPPRS